MLPQVEYKLLRFFIELFVVGQHGFCFVSINLNENAPKDLKRQFKTLKYFFYFFISFIYFLHLFYITGHLYHITDLKMRSARYGKTNYMLFD